MHHLHIRNWARFPCKQLPGLVSAPLWVHILKTLQWNRRQLALFYNISFFVFSSLKKKIFCRHSVWTNEACITITLCWHSLNQPLYVPFWKRACTLHQASLISLPLAWPLPPCLCLCFQLSLLCLSPAALLCPGWHYNLCHLCLNFEKLS